MSESRESRVEGPEPGREPDLFALLRSVDLPAGGYAIFGSGPLIVRGIIAGTNDLDVLARGEAWTRSADLGEPVTEHGVRLASLFDGAITVGTEWALGEFDVDELIDTAEVIDGLPFVRLECVLAYKEIAGRPKDIEHLQAVIRYVRDRPAQRGGGESSS